MCSSAAFSVFSVVQSPPLLPGQSHPTKEPSARKEWLLMPLPQPWQPPIRFLFLWVYVSL